MVNLEFREVWIELGRSIHILILGTHTFKVKRSVEVPSHVQFLDDNNSHIGSLNRTHKISPPLKVFTYKGN
jgi:hypothetical protein